MSEKNTTRFSDWNPWIKWGIVIFAVIFLIQQIVFFAFVGFVTKQISDMVTQQKAESAQFRQKIDADLKTIQNGMEKGTEQIAKKTNNMEDKIDAFKKEFETSIDRAMERTRKLDQAWQNDDKWFIEWNKKEDARLKKESRERERQKEAIDKHKRASDLKNFISKMKPAINCEKKIFGKTTFNPNDYFFYNPFPFGLPERCKENPERKKI